MLGGARLDVHGRHGLSHCIAAMLTLDVPLTRVLRHATHHFRFLFTALHASIEQALLLLEDVVRVLLHHEAFPP